MPKNIADEMTLVYNAIQKEKDAGVKLLRLDVLEQKIKDVMTDPSLKHVSYDAGATLGSTAQAATAIGTIVAPILGGGAMVVNGLAEGGSFGLFAGGIATVIAGTAIGSGIFDAVHKGIKSGIKNAVQTRQSKKNHKKYVKQQIAFTKEIAPYKLNLQEILVAITEDKSAMMSIENLDLLRQSTQFEKVLAAHPDLMKSFNQNTGLAPQSVKMQRPGAPGQDQSLSL